MPIIYTYPSVAPASGDYLLISDVSETTPANATRKCTIGDVVDLVTALVPGGGTVTSVALDPGATGLVIGGSPITTGGTFTIGGTLGVTFGGSGNNVSITGPLHGNGTGAFTGSDIVLDTGGTSEVTGVLPMANGGSGISSYTKGDMIYAPETEGITAMANLAIGTEDQVLTVGGSNIPVWAAASTIAVVSIDVSGGSTGLTFSGGPITSTGTITMAGTLAVANGGTGATTLTDGGILLGSATSAITATAQPTNGQLLIGSTAGDPVLSQLTAGANITINNTAGAIEIVGAASGGDGIYGGNGALGGDTTITSGANDLTFTASTGDVIFNNTITPNPVFFIKGAANQIGIGTNAPDASAQMQMTSTTQGFVPPVMTTTQKNAIGTPIEGLVLYDSTLSKLCVYTGAAWETITSA